MHEVIKIHANDNVVVALTDLAEGQRIEVENTRITLRGPVNRGHKLALRDLPAGSQIIKYGLPIGHAKEDIAQGMLVHNHNIATNLSDLDSYQYQPDFVAIPEQPADRDIQIYRRKNGQVGIRNELWILPTVGCVNAMAKQMLQLIERECVLSAIDGIHLFSHQYGCSQLGQDHQNTRTILQNMVRHPNAGGVLVVGLGCENNQIAAFKETLGDFDAERVRFMVCQQHDDEVGTGVEHLKALLAVMQHDTRTAGRLSELKFGLECGGSDG
ncbi:MAG: UxaA family hydrolase, partial [Tolumonas sp.]